MRTTLEALERERLNEKEKEDEERESVVVEHKRILRDKYVQCEEELRGGEGVKEEELKEMIVTLAEAHAQLTRAEMQARVSEREHALNYEMEKIKALTPRTQVPDTEAKGPSPLVTAPANN